MLYLDTLVFVIDRFSLLQHLLMENAEYSQLLLKELMQGKFRESLLVSSFLTFHTFTKTVALT